MKRRKNPFSCKHAYRSKCDKHWWWRFWLWMRIIISRCLFTTFKKRIFLYNKTRKRTRSWKSTFLSFFPHFGLMSMCVGALHPLPLLKYGVNQNSFHFLLTQKKVRLVSSRFLSLLNKASFPSIIFLPFSCLPIISDPIILIFSLIRCYQLYDDGARVAWN